MGELPEYLTVPEVAARLLRARELGDLSENAEYHATKDEQGLMEARIRQLDWTIKNAVISENELKEGVVVPPAEAYRVAFTRGKMILVQIDMRVVEPDFDPEASGAELGDIGIVYRRRAKGGQASP